MNPRHGRIVTLLFGATAVIGGSLFVLRRERPTVVASQPNSAAGSQGESAALPSLILDALSKPPTAARNVVDPTIAAGRAVALPPGPEQNRAIREAAREFVRHDPAGALEWALTLDDVATRGGALDEVTRDLVQTDPRRALTDLAARPASLGVEEALASAVGHWARDNAADAVAWLKGVIDTNLKARLLGSIGFDLADADPLVALRLAATALAGEERQWLQSGVLTAWAARDPHAAIAWLNEHSDPTVRGEHLARIVTGYALTAPAQAAEFVRQFPAGELRDKVALEVVRRWSEQDAPAAANWMATFPDPAIRNRGVAQAVSQWSDVQRGSAEAWIVALPPGEMRTHAVTAHVEILKVENVPDAARWLASRPAADQSPAMIEDLAREWLTMNREAAEKWLAQTSLSAERKQRLLSEAAKDRGVQ